MYLNQIPGRFSRFVRTIVEAMTALPSIVAGLMVYAVWVLQLGMEKSGLAAGFAISVMMLPIVIRAADVVLRLVPGTLTEAAEALGAPRWRTVWHVVLPTARSGLATAVILGTARGIGETSPVLLTAGFTAATNYDPLHGPMISLPLAVFSFVRSPEPAMIARGFGAAAVLMALVLVLFVIARVIGGRGPGQQTRRQSRRTTRASRRDAARFDELRAPGLSLFENGESANGGGVDAGVVDAGVIDDAPGGAEAISTGAVDDAPGGAEAISTEAVDDRPGGTEAIDTNAVHDRPDGAEATGTKPLHDRPGGTEAVHDVPGGAEVAVGEPGAGSAAAASAHEPAAGIPTPAPEPPAAADGERAPQGPPAPDDESVTGGAGGNENPAGGRGSTHRPAADPAPAPGETD